MEAQVMKVWFHSRTGRFGFYGFVGRLHWNVRLHVMQLWLG